MEETNQLPRRSRERVAASPSPEGGNALVAVRSGTHPRSLRNPTGPGASGPRCARWRGCQARPSRGRLSQSPNYAAEPGLPARPPPPLSSGCPRGPGGSRRGEPREHLGWAPTAGAALPELRAVPRPALAALPASRCGGRGARAGVTAPPARPPPGRRRGCGQPAETAKEEARRPEPWGEDLVPRAGKGPTPGLGFPRSASPRFRSSAATRKV